MNTTFPSTSIQIRDLTKTYPNGYKALDGVNLDIPMGMFGLLGPNGAGKSSLMRTIATLQEATTGTIQWGDIDMLQEKVRVRQVLGYLPQYFGVYPGEIAKPLCCPEGGDQRERTERPGETSAASSEFV